MDLLGVILVMLILLFLVGGVGYPRPADGPAPVNTALYVIVVVLVAVLVVRLLGGLV